MPKQIVLHYAGSYVERPHTITFDSEREYEKFIQEKGYRLKPNVEYGVFTLNAVLRTQFQQSSIKIEDVNEADKPDISTVTPPTLDIKYPQCGCTSDKEDNKGSDNNININITIPGLENITTNQGNVNQGNTQGGTNTPPKDEESNDTPPAVTPPAEGENGGDDEVIVIGGEDENQDNTTQDSNPTTPPADNQEEEDVVVIGGDEDTQNLTEGTDTTDTTTGTDTQTDTTDTDTTDETQNENQGTDEDFNRVSEVVSFGPEVTGNDGEESQTENTQDSGDSEIIIPDEGSSENTSPTPGDEDIIVF